MVELELQAQPLTTADLALRLAGAVGRYREEEKSMFTRLEQLVEEAQGRGCKRVAVAAAANGLVLQAIKQAQELGLIEPWLVGRADEIRQAAALARCGL